MSDEKELSNFNEYYYHIIHRKVASKYLVVLKKYSVYFSNTDRFISFMLPSHKPPN